MSTPEALLPECVLFPMYNEADQKCEEVLKRWQTKLFTQPGSAELPLLREELEAALLTKQTLRAQALLSFRRSKAILVETFGEDVMGHRQPLIPPPRQFLEDLDPLLEVLQDKMEEARLFPESPFQKNALIGARLDVATLCRDRAAVQLGSAVVQFSLEPSDRASAIKENAYNMLVESARSVARLKEELADQQLVISLAMAASAPARSMEHLTEDLAHQRLVMSLAQVALPFETHSMMEVVYKMPVVCPVLKSGLAFPVYDLPPWAMMQPSPFPSIFSLLSSCQIDPALLQPEETSPGGLLMITNGEPGH
jgi:hypothetical protein